MPDDSHGTSRDAPLEALAARAASDPVDREAFGALYDATYDRIYAYIRVRVRDDHLAEDLTEGVFLDALAAISRYRPRGGGILAWLFRIARNDVLDHARRRRDVVPIDVASRRKSVDHGPEERAVAAEERERVTTAVASLPGRQRDVIILRFTSGLTVLETAEALGLSETATKSLQFRAMKTLQEMLRDD